MVSHDLGRPAPPLRLTRRGRAVVLALLVLVASALSAVLFATASRADDPPAGPPPTIVVQPGDTLWDIASRSAPRRETGRAVAELRRLNGLRDSALAPGAVLILPRWH